MVRIRRTIVTLVCQVLLLSTLTGCLSDGSEQRVAVDFEVIALDKAPEKLQEIIEEHKKEEIKMIWDGDEGRYLIRGYGTQPTGGYSIRADAVELSGDGLHVTTTLIPPEKEQAAPEESYPVIILRIENEEQEITFEP